jgi:hypothetical protein
VFSKPAPLSGLETGAGAHPAFPFCMTTAITKASNVHDDSFSRSLAPINRPRQALFGPADALLLLVLVLEAVTVMRLVLLK